MVGQPGGCLQLSFGSYRGSLLGVQPYHREFGRIAESSPAPSGTNESAITGAGLTANFMVSSLNSNATTVSGQ